MPNVIDNIDMCQPWSIGVPDYVKSLLLMQEFGWMLGCCHEVRFVSKGKICWYKNGLFTFLKALIFANEKLKKRGKNKKMLSEVLKKNSENRKALS